MIKKGFSLAEILIALAIVAIIAIFGFKIAEKGLERAYDMFYFTGYNGLMKTMFQIYNRSTDILDETGEDLGNSEFLAQVQEFLDGAKDTEESQVDDQAPFGRYTFTTPNKITYRFVPWRFNTGVNNSSTTTFSIKNPLLDNPPPGKTPPWGDNPLRFFLWIVKWLTYKYFGESDPGWLKEAINYFGSEDVPAYFDAYLVSMTIPAQRSDRARRAYFVYIPQHEILRDYLIPVGNDFVNIGNLQTALGGESFFDDTETIQNRIDLFPYYLDNGKAGRITINEETKEKEYNPYNVTTFRDAYCRKFGYENIVLQQTRRTAIGCFQDGTTTILDCPNIKPDGYEHDDFKDLDLRLGNPRLVGR